MKRMMICAVVVLTEAASASQPRSETQVSSGLQLPGDSEIRQIISDRIKGFENRVSITVGIIGPQGRRIVSYGSSGTNTPRSSTGETIYEIGSITKVFTSLLLADMVEAGEVALDDPVVKYLPHDVTVPTRGGKQITLADLATHRSGLPRMPSNFTAAEPMNPYVDYPVQRLYQFLSSYHLQREVDSEFDYSNLGAGLLGHALARRAGTSYEALLRRRVLDPLKMSSTGIALSPTLKSRQSQPHSSVFQLASTPPWDFTDAFAGAGAVRSSADDMLSNYNSGSGIDDIGRHLLHARTPLDTSASVKPRARTVSRVPPGLLDAYAGRYRFSNNQIWLVRREGNRYFVKKPGEAEFEIFPEGDFEKGSDDFFSNSMDALFTFDFEKPSASLANRLTFSWAFLDPQRAERID